MGTCRVVALTGLLPACPLPTDYNRGAEDAGATPCIVHGHGPAREVLMHVHGFSRIASCLCACATTISAVCTACTPASDNQKFCIVLMTDELPIHPEVDDIGVKQAQERKLQPQETLVGAKRIEEGQEKCLPKGGRAS